MIYKVYDRFTVSYKLEFDELSAYDKNALEQAILIYFSNIRSYYNSMLESVCLTLIIHLPQSNQHLNLHQDLCQIQKLLLIEIKKLALPIASYFFQYTHNNAFPQSFLNQRYCQNSFTELKLHLFSLDDVLAFFSPALDKICVNLPEIKDYLSLEALQQFEVKRLLARQNKSKCVIN